MKIILGTAAIITILAAGIFGITNVFAQGNNNDFIGNDTTMAMNATLPTTIISNATLAFAQEEGIDTMSMGNDTGMMMNMSSDHSKGEEMMMSLNGTINIESTIAEAFKSKVTTDIIGAIQAAQTSVGANSFVKEAELTEAHGYLVYKIKVVDENMKKYKVIVDPGNGQVLMKKEITWYEDSIVIPNGSIIITANRGSGGPIITPEISNSLTLSDHIIQPGKSNSSIIITVGSGPIIVPEKKVLDGPVIVLGGIIIDEGISSGSIITALPPGDLIIAPF